jgi:hypothetical protein
MSFAPAQVVGQGNNLHVKHGDDSGLFVQFYMESIEDEEQSKIEGRPFFRDVPFIKIIPVGDKNTVVCRPVKLDYDANTPPDTVRWPAQYAAFQNQQVQVSEGTPLEQWGPITKSQALMFKAVNVHTVEQLAAVSDQNLHNLGMGAREMREKATAYIADAKGGAGTAKLQAENEELRQKIEALQNQMNALLENVNKDEDKPKRGRPFKTQETENA